MTSFETNTELPSTGSSSSFKVELSVENTATSQHAVVQRGAPGSGKSTGAEPLVDAGYHLVNNDRHFMVSGGEGEEPEYRFGATGGFLVGGYANIELLNAMQALLVGKSVVFDNTYTQYWELQPVFRMLQFFGIPFVVRHFTRRGSNLHGVPEAMVEMLRANLEKSPIRSTEDVLTNGGVPVDPKFGPIAKTRMFFNPDDAAFEAWLSTAFMPKSEEDKATVVAAYREQRAHIQVLIGEVLRSERFVAMCDGVDPRTKLEELLIPH